MANRARIRVTGLQELRRAMRLYGQRLVQAAKDEVMDAAEDTAIKARFFAPVDEGTLRDSVRVTVKLDAHGATAFVRATAPHAHLIEFGTERIARQPHLVPPAIRNRRRLHKRLADLIVDEAPEGLGSPRVRTDGPSTPTVSID